MRLFTPYSIVVTTIILSGTLFVFSGGIIFMAIFSIFPIRRPIYDLYALVAFINLVILSFSIYGFRKMKKQYSFSKILCRVFIIILVIDLFLSVFSLIPCPSPLRVRASDVSRVVYQEQYSILNPGDLIFYLYAWRTSSFCYSGIPQPL